MNRRDRVNRIRSIAFVALLVGLNAVPETISAQQTGTPGGIAPTKSLSDAQAIRSAVLKLPFGCRPVTRGGAPMAFFRDLDGNGLKDILLLTVMTQSQEKSSFLFLSDFRRLFDSEQEEFDFKLQVFFRSDRDVELGASIDLGRKRGCAAFEEVPYLGATGTPYGLSVQFPTIEGREHVWILFSRKDSHALFTFNEKTGTKAFVRDLDNDGRTDLLVFEDVFEDSSGHETYITWYRWDGATYRKFRTTNLVRNLRTFLQASKELIVSEKWKQFLEFALPAWKLPVLKAEESRKVLVRLFRPANFGDRITAPAPPFAFDIDGLANKISDIVFPEVLENPFPLRNDGLENFTLAVRLVLPGEHHFFTAKIGLNPNPFAEKMFFYVLE